jgi:two-component system response regulator HydG
VVAICANETLPGFLTAEEGFRRILHEARRAASSDAGVLVLGETGTGKGRLARAIHDASPRRGGPFVTVDCAALPEGLLHSELFGHRRGAFSGAERDRPGRLEAAGGGTLFLDRVDELESGLQAQLLRAIEEREVLPLGESRPRRVDFRLLASACGDLRGQVEAGRFRSDLFYRIKVVELELPPLRERRQDVPLLARAFLADCAERFAKPLEGFTPAALGVLLAYHWPGNVRELALTVEAAAGAARGELVQESDLPVQVRAARPAASGEVRPGESAPAVLGLEEEARSFARRVEDFQRSLVLEALGRSGWRHREAARELGLERHQLKYLCAKLGVRRPAAAPGQVPP